MIKVILKNDESDSLGNGDVRTSQEEVPDSHQHHPTNSGWWSVTKVLRVRSWYVEFDFKSMFTCMS